MKKMSTIEKEEGNHCMFPIAGKSEGTVVTLLVQVPNFSIIGLDEKASRLSKFIDDKDSELLKVVPLTDETIWQGQILPTIPTLVSPLPAPETDMRIGGTFVPIESGNLPRTHTGIMPTNEMITSESWGNIIPITLSSVAIPITEEVMGEVSVTHAPISPLLPFPLDTRQIDSTAGKWILIDCVAPNRPAQGTQSVTVEGQLVLLCGQEIKTTEYKNIPLDGTGKFEVGGMTVTVTKDAGRGQQLGDLFGGMFANMFGGAGKELKMRIVLTANKRPTNVIRYTFLDADGNEIESPSRSSTWSDQIHIAYFDLTEEVDVLTIRLEAYEKVETVTSPFSLTAGLGL
jgi:hypothetical protein